MEDLKKLADEELVRLYAEGNNTAFDILLARHQSKLYSYIYVIVKNNDVADDIFQETFVKAIITIRQRRYVETGRFQGWLLRIAHNLVIDYFRQERNENTVSNDAGEVDLLNDSRLSDCNIEMQMVTEQTLDDVRMLMEHLPANQREVVQMRFYQELSFKEIAEITGVSINTALGRMRYALLNLRRMAGKRNLSLAAY
ncbi:MAG: sigma-70 family RNA polymerase sigma factor [Clostridium sp.]|nr:sigma-70 family RNA polymerase sigma factor [Clostridium sp.]